MGIYPPQVPEDIVLSTTGHISALKVCMCGVWDCECGMKGKDKLVSYWISASCQIGGG